MSLVGLAFTAVMGSEIKGACRWLEIGGFSIQSSEFVKPSFAIISAWLFSKKQTQSSFPGNLISIALYLLVIIFLLGQPDLGMTALITVMWFAQFFSRSSSFLGHFGCKLWCWWTDLSIFSFSSCDATCRSFLKF